VISAGALAAMRPSGSIVLTPQETAMTPRMHLLGLVAALVLAAFAPANAKLPTGFRTGSVATGHADVFYRVGGAGDPVLLVHGYAETGDMWEPLARELSKTHTVIVPDLPGLGRSSIPAAGYDMKTIAEDLRAVVTHLGADHVAVVGHDIGLMAAYAYASQYRQSATRLVLMEAPLPGIGAWDQLRLTPRLWHFNFYGPSAERIVAGRERIYLDRFWDDFAGRPHGFPESERVAFAASYAQPGRMRAGFSYFEAFARNAEDNKVFAARKLTIPVLAIGGERSFGDNEEKLAREVATNVTGHVVAGSGHWLIEEAPKETVEVVTRFLANGS